MKAITIHQPYASLIAAGLKLYETRSWSTKYRGPIAIHASKLWDSNALAETWCHQKILKNHGLPYIPEPLPLGAIVAVATLADCVRSPGEDVFPELDRLFGDLSPGRYGWRLTVVRALPRPMACRGKQGLWEVGREIGRALEEVVQA